MSLKITKQRTINAEFNIEEEGATILVKFFPHTRRLSQTSSLDDDLLVVFPVHVSMILLIRKRLTLANSMVQFN